MRFKLVIVVTIGFIVICLGIFWFTAIWRLPLAKRRITIKHKEIIVWVAETSKERMQGLQNILWMPRDTGMLFVFDETDTHCFWNKNTFLSLKLLFMRNGTVVEETNLPSLWHGRITICPKEAVDSVVEIPVS